MARTRLAYRCGQCGEASPKWQGQCPACGAWNALSEQAETVRSAPVTGVVTPVRALGAVALDEEPRQSTGLLEFDRVLGGGLVAGSVTLIGGEPGIGKSTLALQSAAGMAERLAVLYATGEESLAQVGLRARRLGLGAAPLSLVAETSVESIIGACTAGRTRVLVVDSIQTMASEQSASAAGSVSQLREATARLVAFAKQSGTAVLLIGHVTREGTIAGPRVLEHLVDTVLYFESDLGSRYRLIRAIKNRFGAANEIGVFAMAEQGLREVRNPSAIFLSRHDEPVPGSVVLVTREGSRPLLVEVQALVDESRAQQPRRVAVGFEANRLALLLAVLHRHAGLGLGAHDVFVNVVGGVTIAETAADLAVLLAAASSVEGQALPVDLIAFGELGLGGELRPVPFGEERLREAAKHGFRHAIVPKQNVPKKALPDIAVRGAGTLAEALALVLPSLRRD